MEEQRLFPTRDDFRKWLAANCQINKGIWLIFSKTALMKTLTPAEALEEALCFGWIDGQIKSQGEEKYLKKFTPRRPDSTWSQTNKRTAAHLIQSGKMTEAGQAAIERAKKSGGWEVPVRPVVSEEQIEVLVKALQGAHPALENFQKMPLSVRRTYTLAYLDAKKEETRIKRREWIIGRLNENKKPM